MGQGTGHSPRTLTLPTINLTKLSRHRRGDDIEMQLGPPHLLGTGGFLLTDKSGQSAR